MKFSRRSVLASAAALPWIRLGGPGNEEEAILEAVRTLPAEARGPLTILAPEGSRANLLPLTRSFTAATGLEVTIDEAPVDDVATSMTVRTIGGAAGFDLALPPTFAIPDLVEDGIIVALDDILPVGGLGARDLDGRSIYALGDRYAGKTYGLQTDGDVYVMFYSARLFEDPELRRRFEDQHGVPLTIPRTWAELDRAMAFFHDPEAGRHGGTLFRSPGYIAWEFWIRLHAKGIYPFGPGMEPRLGSAPALEAAEELIAASRWQAPGAATNGLFANWEQFARGNAFCNIGWGGSQKHFRSAASAIRDAVLVGPTPGGVFDGEARPIGYFNWGWNYAVGARSRRPSLAALFALYATTRGRSADAVAADGFFDPFREEHYRDPRIEEAYSRPFLDVHRDTMRRAIPDLYLAGRGEYFDLLGRFLARANEGRMTPEKALEVVAKGWDLITDRVGRELQVERWRTLRTRYPEALAQHLTAD